MPVEYTDRPPADAPRAARAAWDWFETEHADCAIHVMRLEVDPLRWVADMEKTCGSREYDVVRVDAGGLVLS